MTFLIVRLGAIGDILHAVPAAAAIRAAMPAARIDWLVDARYRRVVDLVTVVDRVVELKGRSAGSWLEAIRSLRRHHYDIAFDFQGLLKSAVFARASGATKVAGFAMPELREKAARPFYSRAATAPAATAGGRHVIEKNLALLEVAGIQTRTIAFPLADVASPALQAVRDTLHGEDFALINPGAAWPNKRWPAARFGELAAWLKATHGLSSVVLWGPDERALADTVVAAANGAARRAPTTSLEDLLALSRAARVLVAGDTGPLHIAAAAGTPVVALFGPTDPTRNGPWAAGDTTVSRYNRCGCHYKRQCTQATWCLGDVRVSDVAAAVQQRLLRAQAGDGRGSQR
jgi:lipopolysaccharide heptosyltransferase I